MSTPARAPSTRIHGSTVANAFGGHTYDDNDYPFNKTEIAPHVATLTDESADTSCIFRPENVDADDDEIIIYDLGEVREVKAVELISAFCFFDADVYVLADRGAERPCIVKLKETESEPFLAIERKE